MKHVKLKKAYAGHASGAVAEFDDLRAAWLKENGFAYVRDAEPSEVEPEPEDVDVAEVEGEEPEDEDV